MFAWVSQLPERWRARQRTREEQRLRAWQDLMRWMHDNGSHCYVCGRWHQFGDHHA